MKEKTNLTMLCDFYELTMGNGYFQTGLGERICYFDVFFRSVPDQGGFAIAAGLAQVIEYIQKLRFDEEDIAYLRSKGCFAEPFLDYLRQFRFTGDIWAVPEGTPIFPGEPILTVRAPAIQAQFIETFVLLCLNHQSLIATKSNRIVRAAEGRPGAEFGSRRAQGAEGAILPMCSVYLRTVLLFAPCFLLNHILTAFVRNDGNPKLAMAAMLLGSLSNIVLDYVFLYPMDMGIFGAALATGIAPVVGLCVSSLHILTRRSRFRLRPFRPALRPLADLAGLGSAAFLNECSSGLVLVVFNLLTLRLAGTLGVAAYGIVANLALMALALFTGINQGVQPLASLAHGRGDAAGVRTLCRMALGLALCAGMCMAALAFFAAGPLVSLFNRDGDPALQQMAEQGLRLYFLGFPFAGLNLVTASFLGAAEHPGRSLRLSLLRGFVAIVAAALLLAALLGLTGVWLAFPAAEGAVLLVSLRFSRSLRRAPPEPAPQAITTALR